MRPGSGPFCAGSGTGSRARASGLRLARSGRAAIRSAIECRDRKVAMTATRTETDSFGPLEVPSDRYWGAQTQRSIQNFPIGWEKQPVAIVRALGVIKQAVRRGQHGSWASSIAKLGRGDRRGRGRGDRRQVGRSFPAGRLADRLGHPVEHERQRGDLEPRHRDAGRRDGLEGPGPPQRPRQHGPVVERHLPHRDAHRRRDDRARRDRCPACRSCTRALDEKAEASRTSSRSAAPTPRTRRR